MNAAPAAGRGERNPGGRFVDSNSGTRIGEGQVLEFPLIGGTEIQFGRRLPAGSRVEQVMIVRLLRLGREAGFGVDRRKRDRVKVVPCVERQARAGARRTGTEDDSGCVGDRSDRRSRDDVGTANGHARQQPGRAGAGNRSAQVGGCATGERHSSLTGPESIHIFNRHRPRHDIFGIAGEDLHLELFARIVAGRPGNLVDARTNREQRFAQAVPAQRIASHKTSIRGNDLGGDGVAGAGVTDFQTDSRRQGRHELIAAVQAVEAQS